MGGPLDLRCRELKPGGLINRLELPVKEVIQAMFIRTDNPVVWSFFIPNSVEPLVPAQREFNLTLKFKLVSLIS